MKKKELEIINFKDFLPIVYEDLEPHLMTELDRFRNEIIQLPDNISETELLKIFEKSVQNLNSIDISNDIESSIDTEEREGLCEAFNSIGDIVGLNRETEYLDNWRYW